MPTATRLTRRTRGMNNRPMWKLIALLVIAGVYTVARNSSPVIWIPLVALVIWFAWWGNKQGKNRSDLEP